MASGWFQYKPAALWRGGPGVSAPGDQYEVMLGYARDAAARPHDQAPADLLRADCRELASLLIQVAAEDASPAFLASVLEVMVRDTVRREASRG